MAIVSYIHVLWFFLASSISQFCASQLELQIYPLAYILISKGSINEYAGVCTTTKRPLTPILNDE